MYPKLVGDNTIFKDLFESQRKSVNNGAILVNGATITDHLVLDGTNDYVQYYGRFYSIKTIKIKCNISDVTNEGLLGLNSSAYVKVSNGIVTTSGISSPTIYVNNVQTTSITANVDSTIIITTATAFDATNLQIGFSDSLYFPGSIYEVSMYREVWNTYEIEDDYLSTTYTKLSPSNFLVYSPLFSEINGTITNFGTLNDLNLGTGTTKPTKLTGKIYGFSFDTTDDLLASQTVSLDNTKDYSFAFLFNKTTSGTTYYFYALSSNQGITIYSSTNVIRVATDTGGSGKNVPGTVIINKGRPRFVVCNYKNNGANAIAEIWVDGVLDTSASIDLFTNVTTTPYFFSSDNANFSLSGTGYFVSFADYALTPRQIRTMYYELLPQLYK